LNKRDKVDAARLGTDLSLKSNVPFGIPSFIPQLDLSMRRPGYPAGRIVELYGKPAVGKTTAAYHAIASAQRVGGKGACMLIDTEYTYSPSRAAECGVDPESLVVVTADTIEGVFGHIDSFLDWLIKNEWKNPSIFAVDSVTAVQALSEQDKEFSERSTLGADARAIRSGLRYLNSRIADTKTLGIFVNHAIAKIGGFGGRDSEAAGGNALKFFSSIRVNFNFVNNLYEGDKDDRTRKGQVVSIGTEKSKVSSVGRPTFKVELTEHGFDLYEGLLEGCLEVGLVERINKQSYLFKSQEVTFTSSKWKEIVDGLDGPWKFYQWFLSEAAKAGNLEPYGLVEFEERTEEE
jgi:recombination protein RecA